MIKNENINNIASDVFAASLKLNYLLPNKHFYTDSC